MARAAPMTVNERQGWIAYVLPFGVFLLFLAVNPYLPVPQWARLAIELALFAGVSRDALTIAPTRLWQSILLGVALFALWIAPDQLIPNYRQLPIFNNALTGHALATTTSAQRAGILFLLPRVLVSVLAVPILEELFWRGFLMRWLIDPHFLKVPLGAWSALSFWTVAVLFASEHGPYWDVGLIAGVIFNWWMLRTRNLWDCIIAHAVTNACLAAFVIGKGQWQYWL